MIVMILMALVIVMTVTLVIVPLVIVVGIDCTTVASRNREHQDHHQLPEHFHSSSVMNASSCVAAS